MGKQLSLNGEWSLHWSDCLRGGNLERLLVDQPDLSRSIPAEVPGEVHLDLVRAGIISEPTEGLNALQARWVEESVWFYHRSFQFPRLESGERVYLNLDCLDLAAKIYLNGKEAGRHANAFYPCRLDVTDHLLAGENRLTVAMESGLYTSAEKPVTGYGLAFDGSLHKRHWLRQVQSSFGWDWSPRLVNVGIRGDVSLEICQGFRVEAFTVLSDLSTDLQTGTLTGRLFVEGLKDHPLPGVLTLWVDGMGLQTSQEVEILPGMNQLETQLTLNKPDLWWPVGHGTQTLYPVGIGLEAAGQEYKASRKTGFRRVEVDQSRLAMGGRSFTFKINSKPIFCKGGNFVPADIIMARLDRPRYERLVDRALEANCNFLRVWGGGLYESDDFYSLCDEKGILTWQEFIFACAKYPVHDEYFLADVKKEATFQVRRLAHHPSLVAWCGNNELEWGSWDWGYDKGVAHPDYALFHLVLPRILNQEDGTRFYQPSSPYSPDLEFPNQDDLGDQHPWSVGFFNTDFRDYRKMVCRFPNEGGILGPAALSTVLACLPEGTSQSRPFSTSHGAHLSLAWESHDNAIASQKDKVYADAMLNQWLGKSVTEMTVEDYVYYAGIVQGEGLSEYIRNFRRRMYLSSSAIFWMYNDCWPTTRSWTIVDYYGRRTPAFWPVRRAFQPLAVFIAVEGETVQVYGVNEGPDCQVDLRCGLLRLAGGYPLDIQRQVHLPANTSALLAEFPLARWLALGEKSHLAYALLTQGGRETARDCLFLPFYKEMHWPKADVRVRQVENQAIFESDVFAWRVCLDLEGERALPDNFFDVFPGIPTVLPWPVGPDPTGIGPPSIIRVGNLI